MNKKILTVTGILLLGAGILGFAAPGLVGMHLSHLHNVIHLVSGALALGFGLKGTLAAARSFSILFGAVYGLLGVVGFIAGGWQGLWVVIPHQLELGIADHIVHVVVGGVLLASGLFKSSAVVSHL